MEDKDMKKNYLQPTIQVVKIQTAGMLAVSGTTTTGGINLNYKKDGGDQGDAW